MGQQQLLLLVLSAIIVGISIVVGINMFSQSSVQANQDAVTQDVLTIASRAVQFWIKPVTLGGGGRSWASLDSLGEINFPTNNANGSYSFDAPISGPQLTITGTGVEDAGGDAGPLQVVLIVDSTSIGAALITP